MKLEHRSAGSVAVVEGKLEGYAAKFNTHSREMRTNSGRVFTEKIAPGAFAESLRSRPVTLYYDHDASQPLATTRGNTLTLAEDGQGLRFSADLAPTQLGETVSTLMQRGDLSGEMSFGFFVDQDGDEWQTEGTRNVRTLNKVELVEISVVQQAAYPAAVANIRSLDRFLSVQDIKKRLLTIRMRKFQ